MRRLPPKKNPNTFSSKNPDLSRSRELLDALSIDTIDMRERDNSRSPNGSVIRDTIINIIRNENR